jgi:hypothetical protein
MTGVLGVDGVVVDAIHDVVRRKEVISSTAKYTPGDVEVDHLVFAHGLVLEMRAKEVGVFVGKLIAKARSKLFPCDLHNMLLGHPFE